MVATWYIFLRLCQQSKPTCFKMGFYPLKTADYWLRFSFYTWWENSQQCLVSFALRGCPIIIQTDILLHTSKTIAPRVKSQAKGQNNWSRALKWDIVCLCSSSTFWDTTVFMKMWVFRFLRFCKKMMISLCKNAKNTKTLKSNTFYL